VGLEMVGGRKEGMKGRLGEKTSSLIRVIKISVGCTSVARNPEREQGEQALSRKRKRGGWDPEQNEQAKPWQIGTGRKNPGKLKKELEGGGRGNWGKLANKRREKGKERTQKEERGFLEKTPTLEKDSMNRWVIST